MSKVRVHLTTPAAMAAALPQCAFVSVLIVMSALRFLTDLHERAWWVEPRVDAAALTLVVSLFVGLALIRRLQNALRGEREKDCSPRSSATSPSAEKPRNESVSSPITML